ncbi:MAG: FIST C-terminal domain-containing protein [Anaerovibrio sp.]|uniref:FIST N-terminal domain-containing protein n=1 Tax=Anaerovibrio sp. TaxID=1872532 RepID=UPI0025FE87D7|nr:FIST N-terminal domain-containing protein [Anaerovibrio sp.]MCR5176784.1 FIST C-terminal domain-containing protein [Anaerovibrio sp.]
MRSLAVYTEEMDDLDEGIKSLRRKMDGFELAKNTMGIVFTHPDTDFGELAQKLQEEFHFPVLGASAMSMFTEEKGFVTEGISLHVFTADDCSFVAGFTGEMTENDYKLKIKAAYDALAEQLEDEPKVIIAYGVKNPLVAGDEYVNYLDKISGGLPVFGGFSSDNFLFTDCRIIVNEQVSATGMGIMLIGGRTKPVLKGKFSVDTNVGFEETVTKAQGNVVYKLGHRTLVDAVKAAGVDLDSDNLLSKFVGAPFLVKYTMPNGDKVQVMRHLESINREDGSGTFLGIVPEGATVKIAMVSRKEVSESVTLAIESAIRDVAAEKDYEYSSAIITSCASRLMLFSNDIVDETKGYSSIIPDTIRFSGMYSFGEFCPVIAENSDNYYNCFHNTTFAFIVL